MHKWKLQILIPQELQLSLNKGIEEKYEGMRAKMKKTSMGGELQKLNSNELIQNYN